MRALALAFIFLASPAVAADIYESAKAGYSLIYSDDWALDKGTGADNLALKCIAPICEGTVHASIDAGYNFRYKDDTPQNLFKRMHPDSFIGMVVDYSKPIGSIKPLRYPLRKRIGNAEGFIGTFKLTYKDTRTRHLVYGIVLNKGYIYHIKFISPEVPNEHLIPILDALFDGFQINE